MGYGDENRTGLSSTLCSDSTIANSFRQQLGGGCAPGGCPGLFADSNGFAGASMPVFGETATHVEYTIIPPDPNDAFPIGMYELRMDGTLISWGGNANNIRLPWLLTGAFPPEATPGINTLSFVATSVGLAPDSARVWIDNIKVTKHRAEN